jgi:hypothetical protein
MRIEISKDIFENSDFQGLAYIFQILTWSPVNSIPRYNVFINTDKISHTLNYKKLVFLNPQTETIQAKIIDEEFTEAILTSKQNANINFRITNKKGSKNFTIEEAIRFFSQPVSIVLENNKNDSYFVEAIIYHFDKDGIVKEHLRNGWLRFENAGGYRNVRNFLEGCFKSFDDLASRNNREPSHYYRGMILLDSDKNYTSEPIKQHYNHLINDFPIITFHILGKRAMENYMPDEVYEDIKHEINLNKTEHNNWKKMIVWIDTFLHLSNEQKNFLNISDGFPKHIDKESKERKPIKKEILELFVLTEAIQNFQVLDEGFSYKGKEFKNEFPLHFLKSLKVNKQSLSERDGKNELQEILSKIYKLI